MARGDTSVSPIVPALQGIFFGAERYRRALARSLGIGTSELAVLAYLDEVGQLTPRDVGERLGITTGSTTAVLDRVEKAGYIQRVPNPGDRRSLYITLTGRGKEAVAWMAAAHAEQLKPLVERHQAADLDALSGLLDAIREMANEPLRAAAPEVLTGPAQPNRPEM